MSVSFHAPLYFSTLDKLNTKRPN